MRAVAVAIACLLMAGYYQWQVRATGSDVVWGHDLAGYYNYLAQGLASGHLYLPPQPSADLLAHANPWDPAIEDPSKLHDTALYNGHFYLYHGVGPAVMAFLPWRLITHHDLPEQAAILAFGFLGFLFSVGSLLALLRMGKIEPGPVTLFFAVMALGICQTVPIVLNRVWVYEVAIIAGYCCVSAGLFFLLRWRESGGAGWLVPAGFFFGMAVACRPHLGLAGALAFLLIASADRRSALRRFVPLFALICLGICAYNYARFGDPVQFGTKYLLGNANQTEVHWQTQNLKAGAWYLLGSPPQVDEVFPWFHATLDKPWFPLPSIYTLEPIAGGLFFAPFLPLFLLWIRPGPARSVLAVIVASGLGVLLFIAGTGWSVQRYEVDFLQFLVLAALTCALARLPGMVTCLLILPGLVFGLAMGINGPYNEMLHNRPILYAKIARWFSPLDEYRPEIKPALTYSFDRAGAVPEGTRDVLFGAGPDSARYELRLERRGGKPELISDFFQAGESKEVYEFEPRPGRVYITVAYDPTTEAMRVALNGATVIRHKFAPLITAPIEIYTGPKTR